MGKNSMAGRFADALLGVWCSTEWAATVSLIFIVDPNRLASQQTIDAGKAMNEIVNPIRKRLAEDDVKAQSFPRRERWTRSPPSSSSSSTAKSTWTSCPPTSSPPRPRSKPWPR